MILHLTPDQFSSVKGALSVAPGLTLTMANENTGTLTTPDVELACDYDGVSAINVTVVKRRSLAAKFAPESVIDEHIADMFNQYLQKQ